ncbi:hypothetical protein [Sphingomonas sp.]|uniref:hypothetical protein n=1 Tax=Sphingomonas sp. TaxID=28214 RepID=UPI003F80387C
MGIIAGLSFAIAAASSPAATDNATCYNLATGKPSQLEGKLDYVMFAGPPNFEDVQKGDTPDPSYVLRLDRPICITGDEFADPSVKITAVQVVETKAVAGKLKAYLGKRVSLGLRDPMAAETGHHHEPLVAWITSVRAIGGASGRPMDFVEEYGTPATVIRAFYAALADGQGAIASRLVVPEKRGKAAFSAAGLSGFYGKLKEPIQLLGISVRDADLYVARYRYATGTRQCNGRAEVTTVARNGGYYIQGIKALDGC